MSSWLQRNGSGGHPAVAFEEIGATIVGTITAEPREVRQVFDGQEQESLAVNLSAIAGSSIKAGKSGERQAVQPGDDVTLYIKPGAMARAVMEACRIAKTEGIAEGGTLAVKYIADGERKPGKNPPKLYAAEYKPPVVTVGLGASLIGTAPARDDNAPF